MGIDEPTPYVAIRIQLVDRQLPRDIKAWLAQWVGPVVEEESVNFQVQGIGWDCWGLRAIRGPTLVTFRFADVRKATMFKLTWA